VFTEPLLRNWLHKPVVLLLRVLLRNGRFYGSTVLAWGKHATISLTFGDNTEYYVTIFQSGVFGYLIEWRDLNRQELVESNSN
jgi:hypothetical protein